MPESPQPPQSAALPRGWISLTSGTRIIFFRADSITVIYPRCPTETNPSLSAVETGGDEYGVVDDPAAVLAKIAAAGEPVQPSGVSVTISGHRATCSDCGQNFGPCDTLEEVKAIAEGHDCPVDKFASGFAAGVEAAAKVIDDELEGPSSMADALRALTPPNGGETND